VKSLFPETRFGIGPSIENGFYYDFDVDRPFTDEDLEKIQARMRRSPRRSSRSSARNAARRGDPVFAELGEKYKVELLEQFTDPSVSYYEQGNFIDLCRGPAHSAHRVSQGVKLLSVAGAYWRGDEHNPSCSAFTDRFL